MSNNDKIYEYESVLDEPLVKRPTKRELKIVYVCAECGKQFRKKQKKCSCGCEDIYKEEV